MARRSYYHRSFIILKPESRGYGLKPNKDPAGYCKFEIRRGIGKAYIYLQDIKPSSAVDGIYEAYLISLDDSIKPCKLASLHIDDQGKGEHIASFDAHDIMGSGKSLENFHALAITFRSEEAGKTTKLAYPLIGYSSRDVDINPHIITEKLKALHGDEVELQSDAEPELELEEAVEAANHVEEKEIGLGPGSEIKEGAEDQANGEPEPELETEELEEEAEDLDMEVEALEADIEAPQEIESEIESELESEKVKSQEEPDIDNLSQNSEESISHYSMESTQTSNEEEVQGQRDLYGSADELKKAYEDSYRRYLKDFGYQDPYSPYRSATYWDSVKDYFMGLFKAYQQVNPFDNELKDVEWVRVQQAVPNPGMYYGDSIYRYPYYGHHYPDHYIVGLMKEKGQVKYVIYGIPSMYSMLPPVSMSGFSRWVPIKDGYGMGYWLLYIDAISGRVVYPYEKGMI